MVDFEKVKKRVPEKSSKEKEYDELCKKYEEMFNDKFGYSIVSSPSLDVAISEVKHCIESGERQEIVKLQPGGDLLSVKFTSYKAQVEGEIKQAVARALEIWTVQQNVTPRKT